ncbi:MAG: transposase [Planctomycetes bacterium]|nr:transposase [Planctomycetota bacterium]
MEEYQRRRQGVREFCLEQELTEGNFRRWLKESGVAPRSAAKRALKKASRRRRHFTPEEKRAAVEAFEGSDLNQTDFCATWGLSVPSLRLWLKRHRELGPQGLEPSPRKRALPGDPRSIPEELRAEIIATKERHPEFGSRKIRDELYRFRGLKVAATTVTKVLVEAGLAIVPRVPLRRRRSAKPPRRFERARPGELWQSDITSLVLRREGRRVYLTVFMDDHSRYVVAWSLRLSQRQELVTECLLDGIARFGKPKEVLTDQGRQYFAWRGNRASRSCSIGRASGTWCRARITRRLSASASASGRRCRRNSGSGRSRRTCTTPVRASGTSSPTTTTSGRNRGSRASCPPTASSRRPRR